MALIFIIKKKTNKIDGYQALKKYKDQDYF